MVGAVYIGCVHPDALRELLARLAAGEVAIDEALRELTALPFRDLGFARLDTHRHLRTGFPEVVLGQGKSVEQLAGIVAELAASGNDVLATRVSTEQAAAALARAPGIVH